MRSWTIWSALALLSGTAFPQSTTVTDVFGLILAESFSASVVTVVPSGTVLELVCPTPYDRNDLDGRCFDQTITVTAAPTFFGAEIPNRDGATFSVGCSINPDVEAACTSGDSGDESDVPQSTTWSWDQVGFYPVTITAGLEKLTETGGSPTSTPTPTSQTSESQTATGPAVAEFTGASAKVFATGNSILGTACAIIAVLVI